VKVGTITNKQVEEIAKLKMPDLNCFHLEAAVNCIKGTARSMGWTWSEAAPRPAKRFSSGAVGLCYTEDSP